jgi:hypothetical protein
MDISDVRRRLRGAIEAARRESSERRQRADAAEREYETFLTDRAIPVFHDLANALSGEGHAFKVYTPARSVKLASARSAEEFIEIELDSSVDPPQVIGRATRGRGRRMLTSERPVRASVPVADVTGEDVLEYLLSEIGSFIER